MAIVMSWKKNSKVQFQIKNDLTYVHTTGSTVFAIISMFDEIMALGLIILSFIPVDY